MCIFMRYHNFAKSNLKKTLFCAHSLEYIGYFAFFSKYFEAMGIACKAAK